MQLQGVRSSRISLHFRSGLYLKVHGPWAMVGFLLPCTPPGVVLLALPVSVLAEERAAFSYMHPVQRQEGHRVQASPRQVLLQAGECWQNGPAGWCLKNSLHSFFFA